MIHPTVDIAKWVEMFPLDKLRLKSEEKLEWAIKQSPELYQIAPTGKRLAIFYPWARAITSPYHLAVIEQYRAERLEAKHVSKGKPADVFVMASGEPRERAITKLGGLPYWPVRKPWPEHNGRPLSFLAQVCFVDSFDIVGRLPGDVLLIFTKGEIDDVNPKLLRFVWQRIGTEKLVSHLDLPNTEFHCRPCYGCLFRTHDFPGLGSRFHGIDGPSRCAILEGTKIGGVPLWIQRAKEMPGSFLCSIGSVKPEDGRYPFINMPKIKEDFDDYLEWGDVGSLYVFINKSNNLACTIQNY